MNLKTREYIYPSRNGRGWYISFNREYFRNFSKFIKNSWNLLILHSMRQNNFKKFHKFLNIKKIKSILIILKNILKYSSNFQKFYKKFRIRKIL